MAVDGIKKRRRKERYFGLYTTGQINRIADTILHPFFGQDDGSILLDSAIHAFIERDILVSGRKFLRYSLPEILKSSNKKYKTRRKRSRR